MKRDEVREHKDLDESLKKVTKEITRKGGKGRAKVRMKGEKE